MHADSFSSYIIAMGTTQAVILILCLAVFESGLCQLQACQFASVLQNLTCNATSVTTEGMNSQVVAKLDAINAKLDSLKMRMNVLHELGSTPCQPASSCAAILENNRDSPSGYYWVTNGTGNPHSVYCHMTRTCGGVDGGWMRAAHLDMTNSSHQCPSGLRQRTDSGVRSCAVQSDSGTCSSVLYRTHGIHYSKVCGKVIGFGGSTLDGFRHRSPRGDINSIYVDGVSLTNGQSPRRHIWTFAVDDYLCPSGSPPAFIYDDYFLDGKNRVSSRINLDNPLWDGQGCSTNACCHQNNPPWFHRQLPLTTDDIEMRVCRDQSRRDEDMAINRVEIYIM